MGTSALQFQVNLFNRWNAQKRLVRRLLTIVNLNLLKIEELEILVYQKLKLLE